MRLVKNGITFNTDNEAVISAHKEAGWIEDDGKAKAKPKSEDPKASESKK